MSSLQRRIERIEERIGTGPDDEIIEMPINGRVWRMAGRGVANLLQWLRDRNEASASGDTRYEASGEKT